MSDDNELPLDYEPCGDCGFDHAYEYEEACTEHAEIERASQARDRYLKQSSVLR